MKISVVFFVMFWFAFQAQAQTETQCLTLKNPSKVDLYIGIVNKLKVMDPLITNIRYESQIIKSTKEDPSIYLLNVSQVGKLNIEFWNDNGMAFFKEFHVRRVPEPIITLANNDKSSISIQEILDHPYLTIPLNQEFDGQMFEIMSAKIIIIDNNTETSEIPLSNLELNADTKSLIQNLPKDATIIIENVLIKGPDGTTRKIPGRSYKIN